MNWFYHNNEFVRITVVGILTVFPPYYASGSVLSYTIFSLASASPECRGVARGGGGPGVPGTPPW